MSFAVSLTLDALHDLKELYAYIAAHDDKAKAAYVLDQIEDVVKDLSLFPERGSYPKELLALGIHEYRQAFFKPYRVIYRVIGQNIYVYLIVDGRRDMQTLLTRRLLGV